jgi:hypothetical protein
MGFSPYIKNAIFEGFTGCGKTRKYPESHPSGAKRPVLSFNCGAEVRVAAKLSTEGATLFQPRPSAWVSGAKDHL